VTLTGLEPPVNSPENSTNPALGVAKSGALVPGKPAIDPDLAELAQLWPTLPAPIKAAILALVGTVAGPHPGEPNS